MGLNLNAGQRRGAIAISLAFILTVIAGIILSLIGTTWDLASLTLGAASIFLLLSPIYGYGIFTFARHSQEEAPNEDMTLGRQLIDKLLETRQANIKNLVKDLGVDQAKIKAAIDDLSRLELFNGVVNWESGEISLLESQEIASLKACQICDSFVNIRRGISICQTCQTEYHQY